MAWEHRFQQVAGIRAHYVVMGQGPAVILVHGLGASYAAWWKNIGPLSERYRVYALDLPGHGDSEKPTYVKYDPYEGARFLNGFMATLGIPKASFIGNSAGGLIAAIFAFTYPDRVERTVLVDSAGLGRPLAWFLRFTSVPFLGELLHRRSVDCTEALVREVFYEPRSLDDSLAVELRRVRNLEGARMAVVRAIRGGVSLWGLRRRMQVLHNLKDLKVPLLIVWGREDRIIPVSHAHRAARELPHARVHIIPQCGHWPQMERAEEFNRVVLQFLQGSPYNQGEVT